MDPILIKFNKNLGILIQGMLDYVECPTMYYIPSRRLVTAVVLFHFPSLS